MLVTRVIKVVVSRLSNLQIDSSRLSLPELPPACQTARSRSDRRGTLGDLRKPLKASFASRAVQG